MSQLQVLSYGGGVQSTAIILMAIDGEIPRPDIVVFADTGSELPSTYSTVGAIHALCDQHGIPFEIVRSNFGESTDLPGAHDLHEWYLHYARLPMVGQPRCTFNFKIYPVRRFVKTLVDQSQPKPWVSQWLGITTDEAHRARESEVQWSESLYPLIDADLSREDCAAYISKHYPELEVSKSGCFCCPYQSAKKWIKLKVEHPDLFDISRSMEIAAAKNGVKRGLWGARSIIAFDHDTRLTDFGFEIGQPLYEDFECDSGGCFL
jgi:3'-phosphoadenosine 5'-phosphosulfate sulfotransferase (PAPS reductase)/FAD synthetase